MTIKLENLGKAVLDTQYAVRGPIVARAAELEREGREIIYCNIGNPQALEQKPLTYIRQTLALLQYPELIETGAGLFPADVLETARQLLAGSKYGMGAYSESKGVRMVREAVARFISQRDGIEADPEAIYLTDGASKGVQAALRIVIGAPSDGIMIPIPQYPLYSATITLYEGRQVNFYMDEGNDWKLSQAMLESSYQEAVAQGVKVRAICVINPGNPTGSIMDWENIAMVIRFAKAHNLTILADEVYQENVYLAGERFFSFAKVMTELGEKDVSLFSFHSCSKGFLGECGQRGGYMEIRNIPQDVVAQILKIQSVGLCANLTGQMTTYCLVNPPRPGQPSYELFARERDGILSELKQRAVILADGLNRIPGIQCNKVQGAMYCFPRLTLPAGRNDFDYCMGLLEATGICVVPGSGFGQTPGTAHFRTTILPPTRQMKMVVEKLAAFHAAYK
jgi:aspartate/methionine/tyrosine aminotransferase